MAHSVPLSAPHFGDDTLRSYSMLSTAPGPLVRAGDFLRLNATSTDATATLTLNGRLLTMTGGTVPFTLEMPITVAGDQTARAVGLSDGWIIGFVVYVSSGTITDGEVVASVEVVQASGAGATRVMCLASGPVTSTAELGLGAFTPRTFAGSVQGYALAYGTRPNPNPGSAILITVTASQRWEIMAILASLTTDANAANRLVYVEPFTDSGYLTRNYAPAVQAASLTYIYSLTAGVQVSSKVDTFVQFPFPSGLILGPGEGVAIWTNNVQATDQWSSVEYSYRKWNV